MAGIEETACRLHVQAPAGGAIEALRGKQPVAFRVSKRRVFAIVMPAARAISA